MNCAWNFALFSLLFGLRESSCSTPESCNTIDSLKLGCFAEKLSNREFSVLAGNYNTSLLKPEHCVRLCGQLFFQYAALQNGSLCLCGNSYGAYGSASSCNVNCTGESRSICGGKEANTVYNSTVFIGHFALINTAKYFELFVEGSITAVYTNGTISDPGFSVDISEESGFSTPKSINLPFTFIPTRWGKKKLTLTNSLSGVYKPVISDVEVVSTVKYVDISCPNYVKTQTEFQCSVQVYQGTKMQATWRLGDQWGNISLPDPAYLGVGPSVPQWIVPNIFAMYSGVFLLPSSMFTRDAMVLGLEIYGHTAGKITIFVARPVCAASSQHYCLNNATCMLDKCALDSKGQCPVSQVLNISSSECQSTSTCSSSFFHSAFYQPSNSSVNHTVVCEFMSISIQKGYNLFVIPGNNACKVQKGDILGWAIEGVGLIGHQNGSEKVRRYTAILAGQIKTGYNFTVSDPYTEISVKYLLRAVSAEGSTFITRHSINQTGVVFYYVNTTNNVTSLPVERSKAVGVQKQVTFISVVYAVGFEYFGTRKNLPVEITLNISSATNVTAIFKNSSSSGERLHTYVNNQNLGGLSFVHRVNLSFPHEGVHELYVEAFNRISSVNTTVNVLVGGEITGLNVNLSEPSKPVYQGLQTSLLATVVTGSLVRYKWIIENNHSAVFVNSNETSHVFSKPGVTNITLIASNQAFTLTKSFTIVIVNPLSLNVPQWTPLNVPVALNCNLTGNFAPNQKYAWDYGDGSNFSGVGATLVQHTFAKGGIHNITCEIVGPVVIKTSSSIFVMEPLTGRCLKPFDGVELFDNKTFVAEYDTGNNLTFSWAIQGDTTSFLAVCDSKNFSFFFQTPGTYTVALNISNPISILTCTREFLVEEKISNISIIATPNPAPSKTTVRFEILKGAGNNVTYAVNFSDGYFVHKYDDPRLEFNRTFTAGKRQVVLEATNTISKEIIFYNLTIQDAVKNLSIDVDADGSCDGKMFVAVDKTKLLRSQAEQGTDLSFTWKINDQVYHDKGNLISGKVSVSRSQTFVKEGNVVVNVTAFNLVSNLSHSINFYAQKAIKDFDVIVPTCVAIGEQFEVRFDILEGGDVIYNVTFGDGSGDVFTTSTSVMKTYFLKTQYTMRATAFNQISQVTLTKQISVRYKIKDLTCGTFDKIVALGKQVGIFWKISNGSDVEYLVDYGDGSPEVNLKSPLLGVPISLNHAYLNAQRYQVTVKASNIITQPTCTFEAVVQEPIKGLVIQSQGTLKVGIYEEVSITANITHGTEVRYIFDFGDGSDPVASNNNVAAHVYRYPGTFTPNITASNLLSTSSVLASSFEALQPITPKPVQGLKISAAPTKYREETTIKITWEEGAIFNCTLNFGDNSANSPRELKYSQLGPPIFHEYQTTGHFKLSIRCENENGLGAASATAIAKVEEPIEGLNFTDLESVSGIERAFGQSLEIYWTWLKGSFVTCSAEISRNAKILNPIQNLEKRATLKPEYFEEPGTYVITVRAMNAVTDEQTISLTITLIQMIQNPQILPNPYVLVNYPAMAFLTMQAGSHATSVWSYGEAGETKTIRSLSNNRYIRFEHRFSTPGVYVISVKVWNRFSMNTSVSSTMSIMNPVAGFSIIPRYALQWPENSVNFQFKRNQTYEPPSNASYRFEFGDNSTSEKIEMDSSHSKFNFTYSYKRPGCYIATLVISNEASYVRLVASVSIIQKVETLTLEALHSDQSSTPGLYGRGKDRNILPLEYPVFFQSRHVQGTCAKYKWYFGDNTESKLETIATINHVYPLPGNYTVRVRVYNDISSEEYSSNVIVLRSVVGLFLVSNSPVKSGENVTFLVFCAQPGNETEFVLDTGENINITVPFPTRGSAKGALKNFSRNIHLPFDFETYYASIVQYTYKHQSKFAFDARVTAWNEASHKTARTTVVITDLNCSIPNVELFGGGKTLVKALPFKFDRGFRINSRVNFWCSDKVKAMFQWSLFRADTYYVHNSSMPPDEERRISLPGHVIQNQSSITVPKHTLKPGYYLIQLTVTLSEVPLTNTAQQYVKISTPLVETKIEGGSARSRGWEKKIVLDASKSHDPLDSGVNLKYEWYCKPIKNDWIGEEGCFGRGNGKVESTEPVFNIRARSLLESVEYEFSVAVTPEDKKRAVTTAQRIKIVQGNPPDINIKCVYNCGGKMTSDERFAIQAYCTDCRNDTMLEYSWTAYKLVQGKPQGLKLWPDQTLTDNHLKFVVVKEGALEQDSTYILKVQVKIKGGPSAFAEYNFTTNSPPINGHCIITPEEGEELATKFSVKCNAWVEEDTPLTYEILVKNNNNQTSSKYTLMWYGPELSNNRVILAAGEKENNYILDFIVRVQDVYGAVNDTIFKIKVKPLSGNITSKRLLGFVGELESNIARGDIMGAVQLTTVLGSIVNNKDHITGSVMTIQDRIQVRTALTQTMDGVVPRDIQAVRQLSGSLELVAQESAELSLEAQESSLSIYKRAVEVISKSATDVEPAQIEIASQKSLSTMSSFIAAASSTSEKLFSTPSGNTANLHKAQAVAQGLLHLTNTVANASLVNKLPEEKETVFKSKYLQLSVKKVTSNNLEKAEFNTSGNARFVLPEEEGMIQRIGDSEVSAVISEMSVNPFSGTNSSRMVKSSAMSLVLMGDNYQELKIEGLLSPIDIFLQNKEPQEEKELNTTTTPPKTKEMPMAVHKVVLERPENAIIADIIPENRSATFNVYFRYNSQPTLTEYDFLDTLPRYPVNESSNITSPGPYTFFALSERTNGSGDYFIGVIPVDSQGSVTQEQQLNYTFDVYSSGCYFWSEIKQIWTSEGCKIGNKTSRSMTHCQCTHLTWFGGDLFIPPNKLDLKKSINNLANLYESPALLATVCLVATMYVIALVFARRWDKKDTTKVGLIAVPDNDPTDRFRYEVTAYTGRMGRSTTSNVSIILYGELAESHPITLIDKERQVFESGSVDSFFVTVPQALGPLNYIRIWHDNSGSWPAWYLNQVIIRDIDTDERFVFLCYRWFACDEDDGQVERIIPIAGKEELQEFTYLFRNRAKKDFSDAHLWFSIALRPPRSQFTRVQRVTCCLSILLCTMLANVMWYDIPQSKNNTVIFESGFIRITWHAVVVGFYSSLIVFPINLLIAQIFRSLERRPKKPRKPAHEKSEEAKEVQKSVLKLNDIHTITRTDYSEYYPGKDFLMSPKKVCLDPQDAYDDDDLLCLLMENRLLDEHYLKHSTQPTLHTPIKIGSKDLFKSDIQQPFDQDNIRKKASTSPVSECSLDFNDSSQLVKPEKPKRNPVIIKVPKPKFLLPWWFVFVAWFLCISTSLVAAFFTLLYGLNFEKKVQEEWLTAMFISLIQDIFISQPLKVIGFALFFALILKKPDKSEESLNAELAKDEEWLKQNLRGRRRNALIAEQPKYMAPDEAMLKKARIRRFKERKMYSVIREIVLYAMFVWVVLLTAYGHKDPDANLLNQGIENILTGTGNSWLVDYRPKKAKNQTDRKFLMVSGIEKFWNWTNNTLLPSLYNGPWYNGKSDVNGYMADRTSWRIGVARVRQLRVKTDTCEVANVFKGFLRDCNVPYSWNAEETTKQFKPGWLQAPSNFTSTNRAWRYRESVELKSLPFLGRLAFYSGGGYAEDLGPTIEEARRKIQELKSHNWIDKQSRAVFVEITIYNPHTNMHCVAFLILEVSASGGAFPFVELLVTRIDRYTGQFKLFVLIFELAFVAFTIFFTYKLIKGMINIGPIYYFKEYWNCTELVLISLSWTSIVLYFVRFSINALTQREYRKNPKEFVNFHPLAASDEVFAYIYSFVVFLVSLKFLRLFRFNRRMSLLASTLKNSAKELMCFSLVFGIVFMAFVHFCVLVFSKDLYMFHTVMSSVETLISVMLGKFSYERLLETNRVLAPVMFFFYSFLVVWVLVNMFISIIIENFQAVKRNNDLQSNEYEIVDFMTDQFRVWLGWSTWGFIFSSKNKVKNYPMGKPKYKRRKRVDQAENLKNRVDLLVNMIQTVYFEKEDFLRNDGEVTYTSRENPMY